MTDKILERFLSKIRVCDDDCWEWDAYCRRGYGQFWYGGRLVGAHRYLYETLVGVIPADREIDHLCRNTRCVNPDHMEIVTHEENVKRGLSPSITRQRQLSKTHCPQEHPYDEVNTYRDTNGGRYCRACHRTRSAKYQKRLKEVEIE